MDDVSSIERLASVARCAHWAILDGELDVALDYGRILVIALEARLAVVKEGVQASGQVP